MIVVRRAELRDCESWFSMRVRLWPESAATEPLEKLRTVLGSETFAAWVALTGERVVGFAEASVRPFANGCRQAPTAFLEGVYVERSERRKGIGRLLVASAERWAASRGFDELGSEADLADEALHFWHEAIGFDETERVVYFRKSLE